jgi:RNA methyltransferase, TrmH family
MNNSKYLNITSPQNEKIKLLEKLGHKKYRQKLKMFAVENLVIINDALNAGYDFESLYISEDFADKNRSKLEYLEKASKVKNFYLIDKKINRHYSSLDTASGITAVYKIADKKLDGGSVVYLNGVRDPGNMGNIMRSALAFGFFNIVLDNNCVDAYNHKVISAAKDSIFKLNIHGDKDGSWLKANKIPLYASDSKSGKDIRGFKPADIFCLALGSESHGVGSEIIERAEEILKINISTEIESLNVAAAAAIILYELKRK